MLKLVVQISLLLLGSDHVHHFAIFWHASRTLRIALGVAFKAMLVEGMTAQEVDRRQLQGTGANATLGLLKDLGTESVKGGRRARKTMCIFP